MSNHFSCTSYFGNNLQDEFSPFKFSHNCDIENLNEISPKKLEDVVNCLAKQIQERKSVEHSENSSCFLTRNPKIDPLHPTNVLENLRTILLRVEEMKLSEKLKIQSGIIHEFCDVNIKLHPIKDDFEQGLTEDSLMEIFSKFSLPELKKIITVSRSWYAYFSKIQMNSINKERRNFKSIFGAKITAKEVIDLLIGNPNCKTLTYADFSGFTDFDNNCLDRLSINCRNLNHLSIPKTAIKADALKHLKNIRQLQHLNIAYCRQLEPDALKHLENIKLLQNLNIAYCRQLEPDALKHLENIKQLRCLNIELCRQLEPDALKHLEKTTELQHLNIAWCCQLEPGALKHLENTKQLQSLNILWCKQFELPGWLIQSSVILKR